YLPRLDPVSDTGSLAEDASEPGGPGALGSHQDDRVARHARQFGCREWSGGRTIGALAGTATGFVVAVAGAAGAADVVLAGAAGAAGVPVGAGAVVAGGDGVPVPVAGLLVDVVPV